MRRPRSILAPARVDLSEDSAFLLELLDQDHYWHERLVQELRYGSRTHVRAVSSYQVDVPPELLARYVNVRRTRTANVLLPLTTRDKAPLLNLRLAGPNGRPAALTPRMSTAALQAEYLGLLARTSKASQEIGTNLRPEIYEAISVFTPGLYRDTFLENAGGDTVEALVSYLSSGSGLAIMLADVVRWRRLTTEVGAILADALREPAAPFSSSEEVLLAVPRMEPLPQSVAEIDMLVRGYHAAIVSAARAADERFLAALAEYGRRYELIIEVELPLLEPATIKVEEDLPLEFSRGHWTSHQFPLGEARSVHLEARTTDPNVEIAAFTIHDRQGDDASGWLESVRHTREALAIYSAETHRPYYATLRLRFTSARYLRVTTVALMVANIAALVAIAAMRGEDAYAERVAVLAIPTTVAATFVLIRDQTTLSTRVLVGYRAALAVITLLLWGGAVWSLALDGGPDRDATRAVSGVPVKVRPE